MQSRLRHSGILGHALGSGSRSSYWTPQLIDASCLYFASDPTDLRVNKAVGGNIYNQVTGSSDYLTVTGTGLNARYRTPDNNTYRTADSDYVFWKTDASESTCDGNRLIGYDFPRILIKYLDISPYTILWIAILKPGVTVTDGMFAAFHLSFMWNNDNNQNGYHKGNRTGQNLWTPESVAVAPTVTTTAISAILSTTASSGGNVTADGGATVTARGVCWSTSSNPIASGSHTSDGSGTGVFTSSITGLTAGTTYYVRAYATNSAGTSYGSNLSFVSMSAGETAIRAGNTVAWYDSTDLTTITKDGGNLVSSWRDKLLSGHDLTQGGYDIIKPVYSSNGLLFDGTYDFMFTGALTLNQPAFIYMVIKQVTWTSSDYIFNFGWVDNCIMCQLDATPGLRAYAGTFSSQNSGLSVNAFGILRILFNGASSKLIVNDLTPIIWNAGANNLGALTLGSQTGGVYFNSNIQVKEIILRNISDSEGDEAAIYAYLKNKYSL